jgi:hypothetical protein
VKLDVKTRTKNEIDFNITGEHNNDVQKSLGTLEAKYKSPQHGLTFVEKWNTDNILKAEITLEDSILKGLKVALDSSYSPATGFVHFTALLLNFPSLSVHYFRLYFHSIFFSFI